MRFALFAVSIFVAGCSQETPPPPAACAAVAGAWSFSETRGTPKDGSACDGFKERYEGTLTIDRDLSRVVESYPTGQSASFAIESATSNGDVCTIVSRSTETASGITAEQLREIVGNGSVLATVNQATVVGDGCRVEYRGEAGR